MSGDKAANERRPEMASQDRNDVQSAKLQHHQAELSEDDLEQVSAAGGRIDPGGANN